MNIRVNVGIHAFVVDNYVNVLCFLCLRYIIPSLTVKMRGNLIIPGIPRIFL